MIPIQFFACFEELSINLSYGISVMIIRYSTNIDDKVHNDGE